MLFSGHQNVHHMVECGSGSKHYSFHPRAHISGSLGLRNVCRGLAPPNSSVSSVRKTSFSADS